MARSVKLKGDADQKPIGRPSSFTQETADAICEWLASGKSLKKFCEEDGAPHQGTVYRWVAENQEFRERYERARESQAEFMGDDILEISDETKCDAVAVQNARLRVDSRKWLMSKLAPKKYGDKLTAELGGIGGGAIKFESMTDAELREQLAKDLALLQLPRE